MARKEFSVDIDSQTLTSIIDDINNKEINEIEEIMDKDIQKLKHIAAKFLLVATEAQEEIKKVESMMQHQKLLRKKIRSELGVTGRFIAEYETKEYQQNRENIKNQLKSKQIEKIYEAAFTFHEEINQILGQEIKTIIVLQDNEGNPQVFSLTKEEIFNNNMLSFEEASKGARLTARFRVSMEQLKKSGINAIERDSLSINDELNIAHLNEAYKNIIHRYDTYKQLILWLFPTNPRTWNKSKVSARGDIAEAYSMFFLKNSDYNFHSSNPEENIHYFMILGVAEVDNVSGMLQGDVSDGKYEYAIKSANASYMSIVQMLTLASKIIKNNNYSLLDLQKEKQKLASKKQKIRNPITSILEENISQELAKIIDKIEKI